MNAFDGLPHAQPAQASAILADALQRFPIATVRQNFVDQDECLVIEDFLPEAWRQALQDAVARTRHAVHRSFLPGHKKSGSVSRHCLDREAPAIPALYASSELRHWLEALCGRSLLFSPASDPHAYALYHYSELGDHIGWHYDTSYYRGARYTVLLGIVDDSSSRLEYRLFTRHPDRKAVEAAIAIRPGTLVFFNGDKLQHRVTPLGAGEQRIVLTLEYLTDARISPWGRLISNWKDAVAYFGVRQVFSRPGRRS